jgi:hypothetical protein
VHGVVLTADYFLVDLGTDISLPVGDQGGGFASDSGNCTEYCVESERSSQICRNVLGQTSAHRRGGG